MVRSATINGYQSPGIVRQALRYTPWQLPDTSVRDPRAEDPAAAATLGSNPLRYTDEVKERDQATRAIAGLRGIYTLGRGLSVDINLGSNYERRPYALYLPRTVAEGQSSSGVAVTSGSEFTNLLDENILRYERSFGANQTVDAIAGFTYQTDFSSWNYQEVSTFANDILGANVLQNGQNPQRPQTGLSQSTLASWLGRVNYSLLERYLVTATVRRDGSSKFAANNKWSTFPAVALGWRAVNEPFMRGQGLFSELKFRVSYGKSGNQAIGPYQSLAQIGGQNLYLNGVNVPAYSYVSLANPDLRWETTDQFDGGLDFGLWRDRVTGSLDLYRKNTRDLLQQIRLSGSTGFSTAWINSGNVTNRGLEMELTYNVLNPGQRGGLQWSISGNASRNRNRIESLGPVTQQFAERLGAGGGMEVAPFIQKPGLPIGAMWGYVTNGIVKTAADSAAYATLAGSARRVGDVMYRDVNGDGKITAGDQTVVGDANPSWIWGVTNTFNRGNLDASFLVTAVRGNDIIRVDRMSMLVLNGNGNVQREFLENAWDPTTNPNGRYPMVRQSRQVETSFNDLYVEDGSFVRLKNLQVGYRLPFVRGRSARVYANAINLLTWTKYSGFDPEVSAFGSTAMPGVDQGSYPQSRTVSIGVSTQF
jgi:TonB-linked SusC/RagA family outer membrane protein